MQWEEKMNGSVNSFGFETDRSYREMEHNSKRFSKISKKKIISFTIIILFIFGNSDKLYGPLVVQGQDKVICGKIVSWPLACPGPVHISGSKIYLESCDNQSYVISHEVYVSLEGYVGRFVRIVNPAFGQIENVCGGTDYGIIGWSGIEIISSCNECKSAPPEEDSRPSSVEIWVDRNCGGYYNHGDLIAVYFRVTSSASTAIVTLIDYTTGGRKEYLIANESCYTNKIYELGGTVKCPSGKETLQIIAKIVVNGQIVELRDECFFYIGDCPDSCENIHCDTICRGHELWQQECQDGECVDSYLIEENSQECGYDPCESVSCDTICRGHELWQQECQDGECVDSYLIEENSQECGACPSRYDPESPNCRSNCPDSDIDGVPDCRDTCPETPADLLKLLGPVLPNYTDSKGCVGCYDEIRRCAFSLLSLALPPTFGIETILIDFCEVIYRIAQGDLEGAEKYAIKLTYDVQIAVAKLLGAVITNVWGVTAAKIYETIEAVQALYDCMPLVLESSQILSSYEMSLQDLAKGDLDILSFFIGSPITIEIEDDYGNILNESSKNGIPNSYLLKFCNEKIVIIVEPKGNYEITVKGTQEGTYDLRIDRVHEGEIISDKHEDIYVSKGKIDTYSVHTSSDGEIKVSREKTISPLNKYALRILVTVSVVIIIALIYLRRRRKGTISQSNQKRKDIQKDRISEEDPSSRDTIGLPRHERRKMFFENLAEELSETKKKKENS
ncbi:MAG: hypothetical protein PVF58_21745 [Candidatus Methanofastidiosia archaeon]|jgi:hypothetical protein